MHLIHQRDADAFLGDPFASVPDLFDERKLPYASSFSDIENEFEATRVQADIAGETIQWLTSEIRLPSYGANLQNIVNAWNTLAAHHTSLRSHLHVHQRSGRLVVRVVRRIEPIKLAEAPDKLSPGRLAHITVAAGKENGLHLRLHFRRALIDATSLDYIKFDLFLLLGGLPPQEHIGFPTYARFLRQTKDCGSSREFWATTLDGTVIRPALLPREFAGQATARPRTSVTTIVATTHLGGDNAGIPRQILLELLWAYVLSLHAEADEVVFGTVRRDGSFFGSDSCIGCLDQTYLVRLKLLGEDTIGDAAAALEAYHDAASPHAFVGLNDMRTRVPQQVPVEAVLNYTRSANPQCIAPGLKQFPLVLTVCDAGGPGLKLMLNYITDIPNAEAELLLEHLATTIESVSAKTDLASVTLEDIELVSVAEEAELLRPPPFAGDPSPPTLPDLIEAAVSRHPERTAVQFGEEVSLTYGELNALANGLAKTLKLRRGDIVPLLMDRSADLSVAMLAILKSGASYTVMGTDMPYERNARIVVECNAAIVLADKKYAPTEFPSAKTLNIENLLHEARAYATQANNLAEHGIERPHPSDRCYIIYTSGSTGKPKGTMITHLAAANGITHHTPITHIPRTLLFYSPTASAAQRTFNSVLIHGGTIILAPKSHLATDLASVINTLSVDAVEITPTALALLQPSDVPHLKQVTIAGERIPEPLVIQWASSTNPNTPTPTLIVRNRYGSSECTQMSHGLRLLPGENPRVLGEPQDTTLACVLRPGTTRLAPLGVPGELCLAGPQLAEGYLKEEGLTKKVFVQSPGWVVRCVDAGGGGGGGGGGLYGKMYRTGDKVRRLPGGGIEMLGRIDWQAKINGTKVEPADVDRALGGHPVVAAVATVAAEVEEGRLALVTAVVLSKGRSWADVLASLRQFALKALPPFMVPGFWLPVPELPRSMNGKVDFHALRRKACELGTAGLSQFLVAPTVATNDAAEKPAIGMERDIARVWAAVLGLDETFVRRHHSFLSLGGNSLLAIKAVGQLRKAGLVTDFADLIADKPLVEVALCVSRASTSKASQDTEEIPPFSLLGAGSTEFGERVQKDLGMELEDAYPATALQEGVLATLGQEGDSYTYRRVWNVEGLDHARLKKSFQRVVAERGIYKTSFIPQGRSLIQAVRRGFEAPWQEWHGSLEEYLEHDRSLALSLSGPLFRIGLIEGRYLVTTTHHALCDFWSHKLLYQDVAAVYLGNEPPTRSKFSNFIGYLLDQDPAPAREFWASYLQGSPRSVINYSPVTEATVTTRRVALDLQQTTLGSIVYTAWAIVLSFHLGSHDVSFATAVSGREVPVLGIADMDGPTLTTVPQRVKLNDQTKTLGDLVKDVRASFVQVAKHSQVGLRGALQAGGLDPGSIDSLINVLVKNEEPDFVREVFKPYGKRPLWNSGRLTVLEVEELGNAPESATSTTIEIRLSGTAEAQRLEFIMDSFVKVATTILQSPDQPVSSVDVLGDTERGYLLNTLSNRETLVEPPPQLLHARFEEQAETTPDAIAIDWEGTEQVTYGELDRRANKMSRLFVQIGVQPGDVVALMLDKSIDAVVAILGVLKAGAAYTPLSPENPSERNSLIINESQAKVLVIHQQHADFAHHHHPSPTSPTPLHTIVLNTTTAQTWLASQPPTNPHIPTTPTHLAYLLYTSGSTGQPKGIQVPHASAAAAVGSMIIAEGRHPPLSPSTLPWRTLQFASLVFDASVQDLFNTLSTGGTLCMAATDRLLSDLGGCARALGARQAILTPTVAGLLRPEEVPGLKVLVVGGEPLTEMVVRRWGRRCRVVNVYGPTETCMVVAAKEVVVDGAGGDEVVGRVGSIGRPFETVVAVVVDPGVESEELAGWDGSGSGLLRPYGAVGELCIGGPQVSAGYLGRPELTAASFVEVKALGGMRVYRTGDLVRWLPGGELECLGRKDNQVHIHGYRVELGEIEAAVRASGLVKDTAVVLVEVNQKPQIAAFCTFIEGGAITPDAAVFIHRADQHQEAMRTLKDVLGHSLPPYMVPHVVLPISDFPKLPSRKVDRKALKKMVEEMSGAAIYPYVLSSTAGTGHTAVPVQNDEEGLLESMWAEVLGIPEQTSIGREANFRSLGGDSISAISLASLARQRGFALSVPDILRHRTLKDLATTMDKLEVELEPFEKPIFETSESVKSLLVTRGLSWDQDVDYVYPCPPGQTEFLKQGTRDEQMWVLNTVRRMSASIDQDQWIAATEALAQANDILRTTWVKVPDTETWVGVVLRDVKLTLLRVEGQEEDEISEMINEVYTYCFTSPEPFIRYVMITYPDKTWDLVIKMDHAVYDGTLLRILDDHFNAILCSTEIPKHVLFKDFAFAVFEANKSRSLRYWAAKLSRSEITQYNEPATNTVAPWLKAPAPCSTGLLRQPLPATQADTLEQLAANLGVTPSSIFQAAFQLWLWQTAGGHTHGTTHQPIAFDYLVSGRSLPGTIAAALPGDPQTINGTVANFLPFLVPATLTTAEPLPSYLFHTHDDFWAATDHGDVGLDEMYAAAGLCRAEVGSRVLFLFQPFTPAPAVADDDPNGGLNFRWLVMAKSRVRMFQPYALVVEVAKAVGGGHNLAMFYDEGIFERAEVEGMAGKMGEMVERVVAACGGKGVATVGDLVGES